MDIDDREELIVIEKRIDERSVEDIRDRWASGKILVTYRTKPKGRGRPGIPKEKMDELVKIIGKSPTELRYRTEFVDDYPTEENLIKALIKFSNWNQFIQSRSKPPKSNPRRKPKPEVDAAAKDEVAAAQAEGRQPSYTAVANTVSEQTGTKISDWGPRLAVERELGRCEGEADAVTIDWESLPTKAREREAVMRRVIRRELEREIEPRIREGINARVDVVMSQARRMEADARRVLDGRKGVFTRAEYNLIRACLHTDRSMSDEKLAEAFRTFNEAEILLLNEQDFSTLPSLDELRQRKAARNA